MSIRIVYQTLEDRNSDLDRLETNGPYACHWENTWLGNGYYFWNTLIENAHWWGKEVRQYSSGYIICKAVCDFNDNECFDLFGNLEHLQWLKQTYEIMKGKGLITNRTTVKTILAFLKGTLKSFDYVAVRANGLKSKGFNSDYSVNVLFEPNKPQYLDLLPAVQICFFSKDAMSLRNYSVVYPEEYAQNEYI